MKKTIIVNGGVGFIGHHLCCELSKQGHKVIAVDRMQQLVDSPNISIYQKFIDERLKLLKDNSVYIEYLDVENEQLYEKVLDKYQPQIIYHMNAIANARICNIDPHSAVTENLVKVEKVLNALRKKQMNCRFVFASSSVAYGNFKSSEVNEKEYLDPINIYGYTKKSAEELIMLYFHIYNIDYTIIRPSALYGPRCINQRITQLLIEKYLKGETITINGDGEERLDFTFIEDTVQGFIKAGLSENGKKNIFNITYGESRSINELVNIAKAYLKDIKIKYISRDDVMPFRGTLNIDKAKELIGYSPAYNLEKGYPKYIEWYMQNKYMK